MPGILLVYEVLYKTTLQVARLTIPMVAQRRHIGQFFGSSGSLSVKSTSNSTGLEAVVLAEAPVLVFARPKRSASVRTSAVCERALSRGARGSDRSECMEAEEAVECMEDAFECSCSRDLEVLEGTNVSRSWKSYFSGSLESTIVE